MKNARVGAIAFFNNAKVGAPAFIKNARVGASAFYQKRKGRGMCFLSKTQGSWNKNEHTNKREYKDDDEIGGGDGSETERSDEEQYGDGSFFVGWQLYSSV